MPIDVQMPDGTIISGVPDNVTQSDLLKRYQAYTPPAQNAAVPDELGRYDAAKQPTLQGPQSGGMAALQGSAEQIQADISRLAGKIGFKDVNTAEREAKQHEAEAARIYKPTEEGWTEAPFTKLGELAGGSLPYMAAPIAAGVGALALPEIGLAGGLIGTADLAAGAIGAAQFTGSNLSRQVQEGKTLEEASLLKAGAAAIPQAALDVFGLHMLPGIRGIFSQAGVKASDKALEEVAKKGILEQAGYYAKQTGKTMTAEGLNEAGQQFFERLQAGLNIADEDARKEYYDNFIGGAVLGGAFSVPGHAYEAIKARKPGEKPPEEPVTPSEQAAPTAAPVEQPVQAAPPEATPPVAPPEAITPVTPPIEPPKETGNVWEHIQNRDRSTPASIAQMAKIASEPDYNRVSFSRDYGSGAPVIAGDVRLPKGQLGRTDTITGSDGKPVTVQYGVVDAGQVLSSHNADGTKNAQYSAPDYTGFRAITNGRVAGLQAAYRSGSADQYRQALVSDDLHGVDKAEIDSMKNPMLVRIMPMEAVNKNIGDVSNTGAGLTFNAVEQAKNDTNRVDLSTIQFNDNGEVSPQTVRDFVKAMPTTEQGNLIGKDNNPTKQAVDRLEAAIFQQAYGNDKLTELAFQAQDEEAKNIIRALNMAASKAIRLTDAKEYDVRPYVNEAVELAINARRNGENLKETAKQADMTVNPLSIDVLSMFADNPRSAKAIGDNLSRLFDDAHKEANKSDTDMFGAVPKRPVHELVRESLAQTQPTDLFTEPSKPAPKVVPPDTAEPKSFQIKKPLEEIAAEISKMTKGSQVAQWLVDNAPNSAAKAIALRILPNINALEAAGIPVKISVRNGKDRKSSYGSSQPIMLGNKIAYYNVEYNGLNEKGVAEAYPPSRLPTGTRYSTLMHELLHVLSQVQLDTLILKNFKGPEKIIQNELRAIFRAVKAQIESDIKNLPRANWHPAVSRSPALLKNVDELWVRSLTEHDFQDYLSRIDMGKKTALTKLMEVFRKVLGLDPQYQSALDKIMKVSDRIFEQTPEDINRLAKHLTGGFASMPEEISDPIVQDGLERQDLYDRFSPKLKGLLDKYAEAFKNALYVDQGRWAGKEGQSLKIKEGRAAKAYEKAFKEEFPNSKISADSVLMFVRKQGRFESFDKRFNALTKQEEEVGNANDNGYHLQMHQDMQYLASQNKSTNMGAANYIYLTKEGGEAMDNYYNKTIVPYLEKYNYPDRFTDKMSQLQKDVVNNWKKEPKFDKNIKEEEVGDTAKPSEGRNFKGEPVKASWSFPEDTIKHWHGVSDAQIDDLIYKLQDKQIDTKRAQQAIEKVAGEIEDNVNVYDKEQLYHGRTATGIREFLLNELMPAIKKLRELGLTPEEIREYLHNRHAEERNNKMNEINKKDPITGEDRKTPWELQDRASGISTKAARDYLANLDPKKKAALDKMAALFDKMVEGTQKILVDSGAETQETIDAWNDTYKHYIPLFRVEEDFAKHSGIGQTGQSKGFGVRGNFAKRAMGSEKAVDDILGNLIAQRERALIRAEKIKVGTALFGLTLKNPNPGVWMPVIAKDIKNKKALIEKLRALGFDDAEEIVNNIMGEPQTRYISKTRKIDPDTGLPTSDTEENVRLKTDNLKRFGDNVFPVRINGEDAYIFFSKTDPVAQRMVHSLLNLDADSLGTIEGVIGKMTRWFASVNTQYNPIFGAVNLIRDVSGAMFNLSTTALAGMQGKVSSGVFPAMRGIMKVLRDERKGIVGDYSKDKWAQRFQEFRREGGQTGYRDSLIRTDEETAIIDKELAKMKSGNAKKAFSAVMGALTDFNDMMENSVRLSAYDAAVEDKSKGGKGLSPQKAAIIAKNLTVNFDKKGQLSARINSYYAFFNASVQGTARLAQTLKGPMGRKIIAGGIGLGTMQAVMLAAAGFKDDEPPEFVRERNFIIPLPNGKYIGIPYPLGLHILPNIGRITTEFMLGGGKHAGTKVANLTGSIMDAFSPVGSSGLSIQTVLPTVLDPIAALESNKDAFGRPIYKEDRATNPTPGYMRSRETASEINKQISYFLNLASGGGKYSKGFLSPTADELDYIVGQVTGGAGRELMKTEQAIKAGVTGEELPAYRIPLAGRFYGETQSNAAESARFYNNVTRMADYENEIKGRQKHKENVAEFFKDHPQARFWQMANTVENQVNALNKQKKEFQERGLPKDRIQRLDNQKALMMKRFNEHIAKYEE